jgi:hypothetical protein
MRHHLEEIPAILICYIAVLSFACSADGEVSMASILVADDRMGSACCSDEASALSAGADMFLAKPFSPSQLIKLVNRVGALDTVSGGTVRSCVSR